MNHTRQLYLKNEWNQYPFLEEKVFTVLDFIKYFAKLNSGEKKLKNDHYWLAGRVSKDHDSFFITSMGETLALNFNEKSRLSKEHSNKDILETGDQVLIQGYWNEVQIEGFEARVKNVYAHQAKLLAPCQEPYSIENFN